MELAGHGGFGHLVTPEIADGAAQLAQSDPGEVVAGLGQHGISMSGHAQAISVATLTLQGLGHEDRITAPAGDKSHAARRERESAVA